jgi:hypothetical protein
MVASLAQGCFTRTARVTEPDMAGGRWYPSLITLRDARAGGVGPGRAQPAEPRPEIYTDGAGWTALSGSPSNWPQYALTAMTAACLAGEGQSRIGTLTLLNTLLDYAEPGPLGVFTDEKAPARLEKRMAGKGFLAASDMATTFDLLRANDLVFGYVVSNWLMGERPPAFDILAWNADSTRMPAAMHSFYLRSLYQRNELARGEMELAGRRLKLADVTSDTYVVGAINDHIVPWRSSYRAAGAHERRPDPAGRRLLSGLAWGAGTRGMGARHAAPGARTPGAQLQQR